MSRSSFNMQEIEFIAGKMESGKCPCFTVQSLTFSVKAVNSPSHCSVDEKQEGTPCILITAVANMPSEPLPLPGLAQQHCDFNIWSITAVKIKAYSTMDLVSISIYLEIFSPFLFPY